MCKGHPKSQVLYFIEIKLEARTPRSFVDWLGDWIGKNAKCQAMWSMWECPCEEIGSWALRFEEWNELRIRVTSSSILKNVDAQGNPFITKLGLEYLKIMESSGWPWPCEKQLLIIYEKQLLIINNDIFKALFEGAPFFFFFLKNVFCNSDFLDDIQ